MAEFLKKLIRRLVLAVLATASSLLLAVVVAAALPVGRGLPWPGGSTSTNAYWLAASDGRIVSFGGATVLRVDRGTVLNKPVVGMAVSPWREPGTGRSPPTAGSSPTAMRRVLTGAPGAWCSTKPVVGMATTPDGNGYWLVASDGGIFSYWRRTLLGQHGEPATEQASRGNGVDA